MPRVIPRPPCSPLALWITLYISAGQPYIAARRSSLNSTQAASNQNQRLYDGKKPQEMKQDLSRCSKTQEKEEKNCCSWLMGPVTKSPVPQK